MMNPYFHTITEENKLTLNKPSDSDVVYYSQLKEWYTTNAFRSFSLKYVVDHCIYYKVGTTEHAVGKGNFLLACKQPDVKAYFDSNRIVKSICIDICPATVAEAFTVLTAQGDPDFDNYMAGYFQVPEFFEAVCPVNNAQFRGMLNELVVNIARGQAENYINREWFLELIEKIIFHEYGNYLALNGLHSVKLETRKEILRRLKTARQFIEDEFLDIDEIKKVAAICNMSEFHFYRSFKQAFNISPYQYLLNKRLEFSIELINRREMSLTSIATHCNFPDLFTFSKAFKRRFHTAPSRFIS